MNLNYWLPGTLCGLVGLFIFYIVPQISKFRMTLGIDKMLASGELSFWQKQKLRMLGLKTPFLTTLSTMSGFVVAESGEFQKMGFDQFLTKEHAAIVTAGLWVLTLWSHFSGLQRAAEAVPVTLPQQRNT